MSDIGNLGFDHDEPMPRKPFTAAHDVRLAEEAPWENGYMNQWISRCWVRRRGGRWQLLGEEHSEAAAYDLFLAHPDLTLDVLVLPVSAGDPNLSPVAAR